MYDPPAYVWALTIGGPAAIAAATCIALYGGVPRAGLGRRRATPLAGAAAILLGGWFTGHALYASDHDTLNADLLAFINGHAHAVPPHNTVSGG